MFYRITKVLSLLLQQQGLLPWETHIACWQGDGGKGNSTWTLWEGPALWECLWRTTRTQAPTWPAHHCCQYKQTRTSPQAERPLKTEFTFDADTAWSDSGILKVGSCAVSTWHKLEPPRKRDPPLKNFLYHAGQRACLCGIFLISLSVFFKIPCPWIGWTWKYSKRKIPCVWEQQDAVSI